MTRNAGVIVAVDHHEARAEARELLQDVGVARGVRGREHDAIHLPAAQELQLRALFARVFTGAAQQEPEPPDAGDRLDARDDFHEKRVHQIGNDDAEGVGAAEGEAAGNRVALIPELLHLREDAGAGGFTDVVVVVQHLRDGRNRHAQLAGNPLHRGLVHRF
jgi:hypothetical protein